VSIACASSATVCSMLLSTPGVLWAQGRPAATADVVRQAIARRAGTWITSNARYRTEDNGEPAEYGTHFRPELGGVSLTGCLWGQTDGAVVGVYWHFFTGWDPETETLLVYQSGRSGVVGIGYEELAVAEEPDIVEQLFAPLPGDEGRSSRIRHRSTWIGRDTLETESFDGAEGGWTPRRSYVWVRRPDVAAPCARRLGG